MSRWAPDAALRLERAALELFSDQGYAATTVPEIAARAGLTTRTYFRHFADKREVLFLRERELPEAVAQVLADAPASLPPLEIVMHGLTAIAAGPLAQWKAEIRARRSIISRDPALRERELLKNAILADVIARALVSYAVESKDARLLAQYAVLIFDVALGEWLDADDGITLVHLLEGTQERLQSLTALPSQR